MCLNLVEQWQLLILQTVVVVVQLMRSLCPFAMYAFGDVNENVPLIHHTNCDHYVLCPVNCTKEIHSIIRIWALMALPHKLMVGLVLMEMLILYICDILDYCGCVFSCYVKCRKNAISGNFSQNIFFLFDFGKNCDVLEFYIK